MGIEFHCSCGKKLGVAEEHAGKRVKCPACQSAVVVPAPVVDSLSDDDAFRALMEEPEPKAQALKATRAVRPESSGERPPAPPPPPYRGNSTGQRTLAGLDPEVPKARREKGRLRSSHPDYDAQHRPRFALSAGLMGGLIGMLIGIALLVVGLLLGRIIIWSVVIFAVGLISTIRGLLGHSED